MREKLSKLTDVSVMVIVFVGLTLACAIMFAIFSIAIIMFQCAVETFIFG